MRGIELSLPQRCGAHSASQTDIDEAVAQAMTALHDRYADTDYATQQAQALEKVRAMAEAALGLDLSGVDMSDSEAVLRHAEQQWVQARRALLSSKVRLYAALGGGSQDIAASPVRPKP